MAVDGPGNFDSDRAHDYLTVLLMRMIRELVVYFSSDRLTEFPFREFPVGEGVFDVMACIDILVTLSKHYDQFIPVHCSIAQKWAKIYLENYDELNRNNLYESNIIRARERRAVIEKTFAEFEELCDDDELPTT